MAKESEKFLKEFNEAIKKPNSHEAEDKELETALGHIWDIAKEFKMDPFPTNFEVVPPHIMYEVGSYGLPVRTSHWTHGRDYDQMKTSYDYGMSKIYEVVINSDPSEAFLLENNAPIENKLVMAHVLGHTDFFKNNFLFKKTRRDMPDVASLNAKIVEKYEFLYGEKAVEKVLDAAMAIDDFIDFSKPNRPTRDEEIAKWRTEIINRNQKVETHGEFDDLTSEKKSKDAGTLFDISKAVLPPTPDRDLLGIIRNHAPYLEEWERDVVDIVRGESVYFYPQMRTKIMNEGWASYWHKRIMREMSDRNYITPTEDERVWDMHAGVVQPRETGIQPYYFGMKMFEYIEDRYNGNLDPKEARWLEKEGYEVFPKFEGEFKDSPGLKKVREVMEENDDQSFVRNYFDKNIADRMNLFIYEEHEGFNGQMYQIIKERGWMEIRDAIAGSMDNCGNPNLVVTNIDYAQRNELKLKHIYEDRELEVPHVEKNLPYIHSLWRKPVHLDTVVDGKNVTFTYDGRTMRKTEPSALPTHW